MKYLGESIGYFTIKDDEGQDLFRVYFYENGINFDNLFLRGIIECEEIYKKFITINNNWKNGLNKRDEIIEQILKMFKEHEEYLLNFISKDLDSETPKSKEEAYYSYLKSNKELIEITKKDFESHIKSEKIGEYYVDNLKKIDENTKFFSYKSEEGKDCYIMVLNNKIKIGFID